MPRAVLISILLIASVTGRTAPPGPTSDDQFQVKPADSDECYEERTFTVVAQE